MPKNNAILPLKWQERLYWYSLLFFALLLPFQPTTPPLTLSIMLMGLAWLLSLGFKAKYAALLQNRPALLLVVYFLWCVFGLLYTSNLKEGSNDVFQKIPFLAFALLLGAMPQFLKYRDKVLHAFLLALGAICIYSFAEAYLSFRETQDPLEFYFTKLVVSERVPPHYLGMYLNFGYAVLLYNILRQKSYINRVLDVFLALLFFVTLIFLSVRMQYLTFVLINLILIWRFSREKKGQLFAWGAMLAVLVGFSLAIYSFEGSRRRVTDAINEAISFKEKVNDKQTNHRKFLWKYGWESIREHPVLGVGTGAADDALSQKLQKSDAQFWNGQDLYYIRDQAYNFHNEYLQQLGAHGSTGLFILLLLLAVPILGISTPYEGKIFIVVCALSFLTESMLQRQAGILFFSFFYPLLLSRQPPVAVH